MMKLLEFFLLVFFLKITFVSSVAYTESPSRTNKPKTSNPCIKTCPTGTSSSQVCGSDGVTYETKCHYEIENCKSGGTISIVSTSKCNGSACPITICTNEIKEVCGSDGKTYTNECELKKAQCTNPNINLTSSGKCTITPSLTFQSNGVLDTGSSLATDTSQSNAVGSSANESIPGSHSGSSTSEFPAHSSNPAGDDEVSTSGSADVVNSKHHDSMITSTPFIALLILFNGILIANIVCCWLYCKKCSVTDSNSGDANSAYQRVDANNQTHTNANISADRVNTIRLSESKRGSIVGRKSTEFRLSESGKYNGICDSPQLSRALQNRLDESPAANQLGVSQQSSLRSRYEERTQTYSSHNIPNDWHEEDLWKLIISDESVMSKFINLSTLKHKGELSYGSYGAVWLYYHEEYQDVAVKTLYRTKKLNIMVKRKFVEEICITASLDHPNIIKFLGVSWDKQVFSRLKLVIEYMPDGDLMTFLEQKGSTISWHNAKLRMAIGVAKALKYLHSRPNPIIHRDIKSKNIMLLSTLDVKVIDFGVSRRDIDDLVTPDIGTPYWKAPEVLSGEKYNQKVDIYSFGVVLSELDTCKIPYHDVKHEEGEMYKKPYISVQVMEGITAPTFTSDCPTYILDLAKSCLELDPSKRPTASRVLAILSGKEKLLPLSRSCSAMTRRGHINPGP